MRIDGNKGYIDLYFEDNEGVEYEEEICFPIKFEVCYSCGGKGTHVNRAIDSHGISAEEFAEDPDFEEAYFSGIYDVQCEDCHGRNVMPHVDEEACKHMGLEKMGELEIYYDKLESDYQYEAMCASERRMGA